MTESGSGYPLSDLSDSGMLWYLNRVAFHPQGFALAFIYEDDGTVSGWTLQGDGSEVWTFSNEVDDKYFSKAQEFFARHRT